MCAAGIMVHAFSHTLKFTAMERTGQSSSATDGPWHMFLRQEVPFYSGQSNNILPRWLYISLYKMRYHKFQSRHFFLVELMMTLPLLVSTFSAAATVWSSTTVFPVITSSHASFAPSSLQQQERYNQQTVRWNELRDSNQKKRRFWGADRRSRRSFKS